MKLDFSDINILLIGDLMVDHYIMGTSNRISPEAPVPVVVPQKEYSIPGGAGNVAMNLRAIGSNVTCLGTVGNDVWGKKLISTLKNEGVNIGGIDIVEEHPTTLKQRIYSDGKQVARLDTEKILEWSPQISDYKLDNYDACIVSDYNKGVVSNISLDIDILIVDPKKDNFSEYNKVKIITPNLSELQKATKIEIKDNQSIVVACDELIKKNNFDYIVAKKGDKGITIVGQNNYVKHVEAHTVKNPDVTGAGDTVIAVLSVVYAKTKDIELSVKIANAAAAIVVGKPGTAATSVNEIEKLLTK
ncbi:PfkB family carbohydrate kinase [Candidatus Marinimicrobia bacterium]|nr:PfkB family carbohydrate kinase [Candidatus Neomarinimicrobiota bacterium]MDC1000294.1 PfkB family carbohydrate kinase [Candidatus Neomarinimicrobiota bacterium]